ncbi:cytoglobin-1 [Parasteatoda tepidariorum]|uniref:cytoglobin-1 n=1 Tax=Parasteatoda tepidariorum TaxID=114398 RepID=UPI00077FA92E|nr:cytoglobin-1 [Parasteatoda tepidariorum]XP_015926790.1 cytoglobin-1 [Parasteatoda tepidariorum]XP_015926791.1 cytoglobin-1 [Parasteatoda tepidariorum]
MGCTFAKAQKNGSVQDLNHATEAPAAPPPQDPRIPLTARQKFSISKSWKAIARAMDTTGVAMFVKLFEENAELLELFEKFKHLKSRQEQEESEELKEHAVSVMNSLDEGINTLENVDQCIDYLRSVGKRHRKINGFKSEYFWKMEAPFLAAVKETLDDRYTENMESIYKITIHFILQTVIDGFEGNPSQNNV